MAITLDTHTFGTSGGAGINHTISANAKVFFMICMEMGTERFLSNVQFNGTPVDYITSVKFSFGFLKIFYGYIDTTESAGTYPLTWTVTPTGLTAKVYIESMTGAAGGAPESVVEDEDDSASATVGDGGDLTVSEGAFIMSAVINSSQSPTLSGVTTVTKEVEDTSLADTFCTGMLENATSGTKSVDWTFTSTSTYKLSVAVSIAPAAPAIGRFGKMFSFASNTIKWNPSGPKNMIIRPQ